MGGRGGHGWTPEHGPSDAMCEANLRPTCGRPPIDLGRHQTVQAQYNQRCHVSTSLSKGRGNVFFLFLGMSATY